MDNREGEVGKFFRLQHLVRRKLVAAEPARQRDGGAQRERGQSRVEGALAPQPLHAEQADHDDGAEETGGHAEKAESGGGGAEPPAAGERGVKRQQGDGDQGQADQKKLLRVEAAENILPRKRESEDEAEKGGERRKPTAVKVATGEDEKGDGDRRREKGIAHRFEALVPMAVGEGEAEIEELGEDDAVLVVRSEQRAEEVVVVEPRSEELQALGVPLIPLGHRHAVAVKHGPAHAEDEREQAAGEGGGRERGEVFFEHGRSDGRDRNGQDRATANRL